ncbi:hypothetical protein SDC9_140640 [bioreactor metagenome]|uniref:Uncharacterized protein n=1 Tax=bioreactor metagenome TaxID=1076179 RepID=A0A645DYU0_9ZZZZ
MGNLLPDVAVRLPLHRVHRAPTKEQRVKIDRSDNLHPISRIFSAEIRKFAKAFPSANLPDAARRRRRLILRVCLVHIRPPAGAEEATHHLGIFALLVLFKHSDDLIAQVKQDIVLLRIAVLEFIARIRPARRQ